MVNITLSIPEELKKEMDKFPEINWSAVARETIKKRIFLLTKLREFTRDSELTEKDALELGRKINKAMHEKLSKEDKSN